MTIPFLDLLLSNDPGHTNIMFVFVYDKLRNSMYYRRLTRGQYYHQGKVDSSQKKTNRWNLNLKELFEGQSRHHFKTSDCSEYQSSIEHYSNNYDSLWKALAVTRKRSRLNFRIYSSKNKSIDSFLQKLKIKDEDTPNQYLHRRHVMLYGSGSFPCGGRGERSVPLKYIKKRCSYFFECHEVNEFRTSQICPDCGISRLHDVEKTIHGEEPTKIRGLKWCSSGKCRHSPLKNRDEVGSKNIMKRGLGDNNPLFDKEKHPWKGSNPSVHFLQPPH